MWKLPKADKLSNQKNSSNLSLNEQQPVVPVNTNEEKLLRVLQLSKNMSCLTTNDLTRLLIKMLPFMTF